MNQFIHYGEPYNPNLFKPIQDRLHRNKPIGGLWASPVDSTYGWKQWCENEDFRECTGGFKFDIKGEVLVIDSEADIHQMPWVEDGILSYILFTQLARDYDAILLTEAGEGDTRWTENDKNLYGWDCECVLILNQSAIINIKGVT